MSLQEGGFRGGFRLLQQVTGAGPTAPARRWPEEALCKLGLFVTPCGKGQSMSVSPSPQLSVPLQRPCHLLLTDQIIGTASASSHSVPWGL